MELIRITLAQIRMIVGDLRLDRMKRSISD